MIMKQQQNSEVSLPAGVVELGAVERIYVGGKVPARNSLTQQNSEASASSNTKKLKLPEVILRYIIEQAKEKNTVQKNPSNKKFMKAAAKITQSKKMKDKYLTQKCDICQAQVPRSQKTSMSNCQHQYCLSCLHQYIIYKVGLFQEVECPFEGCYQKLDQTSTCYSQLPLEARKKYKKIKQYSQLLQNPGQKLCPNEECSGILAENVMSEQLHELQCQTCKKVYCSQCHFEKHKGECDPHQLAFFQNTLHYRQCVRCKNVIEKSAGCNHMTCRCRYQFCYVCGAKWSASHVCANRGTEPVFNEPECQCLCFQCNLEACQCCECCSECVGNGCDSLQECCDSVCEPVCNLVGLVCCACCEAECDQTPVCLVILLRGLFFMVWLTLILPALLLNTLFVVIIRFVTGLLMGLFAFPIVISELELEFQCHETVLMVIFFPLTLIYFVLMAMKITFDDEGLQQVRDMAGLPVEILKEAICQ